MRLRDNTCSSGGTTIPYVLEKQYLCNAILKDRLHSRFRPYAEACESQASPKQVPSKSHFLADKDGRQKGGRRDSGFMRFQKASDNVWIMSENVIC